MSRIGVLGLQGDFAEHLAVLKRLGAEGVDIRRAEQLAGIDGLIIPGGESTTISRLMAEYGITEPLRRMAQEGFPIWGTCAGMIVMAKRATDLDLPTLQVMDIAVRRNAFGRQVDSFEEDLVIDALGPPPFHAVFIRAPLIEEVGPQAEVLAQLANGTIVAARHGKLLATSFHPELTEDDRLHRYFLDMTANKL